MDRISLREVQEPLKEQYREDPGSGVIVLRAHGDLGVGITCSVETGRAMAEAGLHPATGGDGSSLCSGDMLLQALVACAGVTLRAVAVARGIEVSGSIQAEGDLDVRGTLGVDRDAPVGFRDIRLNFVLESNADDSDVDALIATTERYCVVLQTLLRSPAISVSRGAL
ncbi:MAG TPA: OsmC family protein [Actinomycetes bacterium]|nr:OsmC family protein [Actinomycetes bacterium]